MGFKVSGKVTPETEKPVPATVAALTVSAELPVEDRVSDCVVVVPTFTLPKATLDELRLNVIVAAPSSSPKVFVRPPALADRVTACAVLTAVTVAVKLALLAPAATVTEDGAVTAELLLVRLTLTPPVGAAALKVAVQLSVPAPVIELLVQLSADSTGTPRPVRPTLFNAPSAELLVRSSSPVVEPTAVGSNCTVSVVD